MSLPSIRPAARRGVVTTAVLAASLGGVVALAPSASAAGEFGRNCSDGPSGKVCVSIVYERFSNYTSVKIKADATSYGTPIVLTGVGGVRYYDGVKLTSYIGTSDGRTATTTGGPGVSLWGNPFNEECDGIQPPKVVTWSGHVSYTAGGKSYGLDTSPRWGGTC